MMERTIIYITAFSKNPYLYKNDGFYIFNEFTLYCGVKILW